MEKDSILAIVDVTHNKLDAIATGAIGGAGFSGGREMVLGVIFSVFGTASQMNGVRVLNMPIFWQYTVRGRPLILAVMLYTVFNKRNK